MEIRRVESLDLVAPLKSRYVQQATAPLDGMWLCGFVPMATHYGFFENDQLLGYCCVNQDRELLQFHCDPTAAIEPADVFQALLDGQYEAVGRPAGVFVSTAEPTTLALCLDRFSSYEVHTLMYQRTPRALPPASPATPTLVALTPEELPEAVQFAVDHIGAPAEWLRGYYGNLIGRGELFGAGSGQDRVALGESRGYVEYQVGYADLGVIVAAGERGKGHGTQVLLQLAQRNEAAGVLSICSTERTNPAAQRAIARAGFAAPHRILRFQA